MRHNVLTHQSTKQERIVYEVLKANHIPFKHRWIIHGREVDFLLWDKVVIEIDGHEQDGTKNHLLADMGYTPIHLHNSEVSKDSIQQLINQFNGLH